MAAAASSWLTWLGFFTRDAFNKKCFHWRLAFIPWHRWLLKMHALISILQNCQQQDIDQMVRYSLVCPVSSHLHILSEGLPQEVTVRSLMTSSSTIPSARLQKVKSGMGSPDWNVTMFNVHLWKTSSGCSVLDILESREMTDWWAKQPSKVICISEDLKNWEARDTTCGHKAKDIMPSIAWRRKA